ncbi:histidine phosphatase family protein [Alteromonas sp. a30]|uniref:histidine phosphatase family protein n=1 Tax=Alteromonas sp. a30 TaxID=2730917 RepID=UPI002281BC4B|nr:histidine phosphatase family protein [Alteromonas sp. a30]MCY7296694.1 histidine phosphatase family protein [Alteromonas sp. a30]
MTTRLIIARHGNTFTPEQTPTRVGAKTDLPLVEHARGRNIGRYLLQHGLPVDVVMSGPLQRHLQTASLVCEAMGLDASQIQTRHDFNEIDYGPDEDKTEDEVMCRLGKGDLTLGKNIIEKWNQQAIVPQGWLVDVEGLKQAWLELAQTLCTTHKDQTTLLVSSNGTMRFAPVITGDFDGFVQRHDIKVATGGVCLFEKDEDDMHWRCTGWALKPSKLLDC